MTSNPAANDAIKKSMISKLKLSNGLFAGSIVVFIFLLFAKAAAVGLILLLAGLGIKVWTDQSLKKQVKQNPALAPILQEAKMLAMQNNRNSVRGMYQAGLESHGLAGAYRFSAREDGLHLSQGSKDIVLPWTELVEVEAGSEGDLRKRVTASRVLLTGVFALALKKERVKDFYVSISTHDSIGLFSVMAGGKKNKDLEKQTRVFTVACNSKIKAANPNRKPVSENPKTDGDFTNIEKLGDLLSKGLITQEEFDKKKKQILGL